MQHMKRFLSLALVLVMALSCLPTVAFAAESDAPVVAENTTTNQTYTSVASALLECADGETVILLQDASETIVSVLEQTILDLNGYALAADYVSCFGDIIDGSEANTGLLTVPASRFLIQDDNAQLPVKDGNGYRFVEVLKIDTAMVNEYKFAFQPRFEAGMLELLKQGNAVTGITIQVEVSWKQGNGYRTQNFVYDDNHLTDYLGSYNASTDKYGKMFTLTLNNAEGFEELSFVAVAASEASVVFTSAEKEPEGNVTTDSNNQVVNDVTIGNEAASAVVSSGTQLESGTKNVTLTATPMVETTSDVLLGEGEQLTSMDVHVEGVSADNTVPVIVTLTELAPEFLNQGNLQLYHVENGETVEMTRVYSLEEVDQHNEYYYDIVTGTVTMALATFSEIVAKTVNANPWNGNADHSWYKADATELTIANADQLWSFSQIVGGMAEGIEQDSFSDKTVKLIADIDLADDEKNNDADKIFYPIGYYNSEGTYGRTNTAITSGLRIFEGTFDGNGHTISNFYHNTWEMKGDHDWYSPEEQYYRDGMGLFGRIYKGTVKNLTVKNFSSDGEIATTGTIAAYAEGATFENISIFNCNPRVYNIGNGGIVGCVGWYAKEAGLKTTFKNITVDNSNKISALWGSYDVACGGIVGQYYPTSGQSSADYPVNGGVHFENCHVAAIMDVYNDVCANYQYYAYRYTGMMIGSIRENVNGEDGHVYPKMDGITASDCTVHFGDWNDYYYCELVANSLASYTHDHQMSRLTQVKAVEGTTITPLEGEAFTVPASGRYNYVVVKSKDAETGLWIHGDGHNYAECYHFVNGVQHFHDVADSDNPNPTETVNGETVLKEDKQLIYREFNQLFTGYGWGVTSKGINDLEGIEILDITLGDNDASVEKFSSIAQESYTTGTTVTIGELFEETSENTIDIDVDNVQVTVSPVGDDSTVEGKYEANTTDWTQGTLTFTGLGAATITITDYYFCTPTTITVNVTERQPEVKFDVVMNNGDFLHRVGNSGTVALDKLFAAKDGVTVGTVSVTVEAVDGTGASGTYSNNAIQFSGTGVVKVTITDNDYCIPTVLYLEVVDATNVTSATSATSNNVVLLNDISSGFSVSGENTFYGNGFTLTYTGNGQYLRNGLRQGLITVSENGTLDNLRIKASIYPKAYMYYGVTAMGDYVQGGPSDGNERYYYQLSGVVAKGNATISNCYIYGGRTNIFVDTGDVTIKDSVLECGTVANVQIQSTSEYTVKLENVTTIQHQVNATIGDTSKVMLGAGVLVGPDTETNPTIVLNGTFKQYNWVTADDANAVSDTTITKAIIQSALDAAAYNHTVNGKTASNLGIIYMNEADATVKNNTGLPYVLAGITMTVDSSKAKGQVCSLQGATASQIYSNYETADRTTVNGDYIPVLEFDLGDQEISYDGEEDTRYLYGDKNGVTALYQDGEDPLALDLTQIATISKYEGVSYDVTAVCKDSSENVLTNTNGVVTLSDEGSYTLEFTVNDNVFYNKNGETITKNVDRTYVVPLTLTVKPADVKNAEVSITKTALDGVYTTVNLTDYKLRVNFLDAISITDYDNTGTGTTVNLSSNISSATLTPSGVNVFTTASTITVTYTDGRVLTVNLSKISGSSPGTKTATINTSGGLYFITDGALDNKPTAASSQNICTITSVSFKGNSGSTVTNDADVTVTWKLGSSSCITGDTLITLADGTQKRMDEIQETDTVLVFDHINGTYAEMPLLYYVNDGVGEYNVINLDFSDGTVARLIYEHALFDMTLNKYVYIREDNYAEFVGHTFAKDDGNGGFIAVILEDAYITEETVGCYSITSLYHLNYYINGMLSLPGAIDGLFNYFEYDPVTLQYDQEKMNEDIETYGLYTYEDFADHMTQELYDTVFPVAHMKVAVGKGLITFEEILDLIYTYLV